jgi:hypothetical protein
MLTDKTTVWSNNITGPWTKTIESEAATQLDGAGSATPDDYDHSMLPSGPKSRPFGPAVAMPNTLSSFALSSAATPFYPGCTSEGRTKCHQWADEDKDDNDKDFNNDP